MARCWGEKVACASLRLQRFFDARRVIACSTSVCRRARGGKKKGDSGSYVRKAPLGGFSTDVDFFIK
jgi:hypothetical protein